MTVDNTAGLHDYENHKKLFRKLIASTEIHYNVIYYNYILRSWSSYSECCIFEKIYVEQSTQAYTPLGFFIRLPFSLHSFVK